VAVSPDPDFLLWSLWAAKEAAYKAWARGRLSAPFSPASFAVQFEPGAGTARVVKGELSIGVKWTRGPDWVHAVALDDPAGVWSRIERTEGDPSAAVRALAVRVLAAAGGPSAQVEGRPPRFRSGGADLGATLSLSHDGPYVAAVLRWTRARQP
jgi:phosphopantetheinyl transferase (holo-ACP synthase)